MLRDLTDTPFDFAGFVEGDGITAGDIDVVVCDGFTGNVALKTAEGTAKMMSGFIRNSFQSSLMSKIGYLFARNAIGQLRQRMDPRRYNGAMLLGLNGISVKSHGGTDALGFANAIAVGAEMVRYGFLEKVSREIAALDFDHSAEDKKVAASL